MTPEQLAAGAASAGFGTGNVSSAPTGLGALSLPIPVTGYLDAIKARGTLRIGLDPSYPPFESLSDGKYSGYDIDLAKAGDMNLLVRPGDVITVRPRENLLAVYRLLSVDTSTEPVDWVNFDSETLRATVQGLPGPADFSLPVNVNLVTEFLSR